MVCEEARDRTNTLASQPDLNVVEHMWAKLKEGRTLRYGNNPPRNPQQLWDQVVEIWDNLAQDLDYCLTLVDSISQRCQSVIDAEACGQGIRSTYYFLFALNRLFFFVLLGRKFISLYIQKYVDACASLR